MAKKTTSPTAASNEIPKTTSKTSNGPFLGAAGAVTLGIAGAGGAGAANLGAAGGAGAAMGGIAGA